MKKLFLILPLLLIISGRVFGIDIEGIKAILKKLKGTNHYTFVKHTNATKATVIRINQDNKSTYKTQRIILGTPAEDSRMLLLHEDDTMPKANIYRKYLDPHDDDNQSTIDEFIQLIEQLNPKQKKTP